MGEANAARWKEQWKVIGIAIAVFAFLSLLMGTLSEGFLEADSCTHYMYARFALREPYLIANVWGRPLCTGIYAIPAALGGRTAVHLVSLALAIACAFIAREIARTDPASPQHPAERQHAGMLAFVFVLAQPLVFLHSFSELTELPFAAALARRNVSALSAQEMVLARADRGIFTPRPPRRLRFRPPRCFGSP